MSQKEEESLLINTNFPAFQQTNVDKQTNHKQTNNFDFELSSNSYWNNYSNLSNSNLSTPKILENFDEKTSKSSIKLNDFVSQFINYYSIFQLADNYAENLSNVVPNMQEDILGTFIRKIQSNLPVNELKSLQQLIISYLISRKLSLENGIIAELIDPHLNSQTNSSHSSTNSHGNNPLNTPTNSHGSLNNINNLQVERQTFNSLHAYICLISVDKRNNNADNNNLSDEKEEENDEKKRINNTNRSHFYVVSFLIENANSLSPSYFEL